MYLHSHELLVFFHYFFHFGFDRFQILSSEIVIEIKIVVETSISRRTYIQLGLGEKTQHSRRQNVRCRVAQFLNRSHLLHCC